MWKLVYRFPSFLQAFGEVVSTPQAILQKPAFDTLVTVWIRLSANDDPVPTIVAKEER
jgi:hypothetical protein